MIELAIMVSMLAIPPIDALKPRDAKNQWSENGEDVLHLKRAPEPRKRSSVKYRFPSPSCSDDFQKSTTGHFYRQRADASDLASIEEPLHLAGKVTEGRGPVYQALNVAPVFTELEQNLVYGNDTKLMTSTRLY